MRPVRPIQPIRPIRAIRRVNLRRVPSFGQLRTWLGFARQKAKGKTKGKSKDGPGQAAMAASEAPPQPASEEGTTITAEHLHIDKRV